jgi:hypothetical protein
MHELVEQFCTALAAWDDRSGGGAAFFEVIMRYLGGSVPPVGTEEAGSPAPQMSRIPLLEPMDTEKHYTVDEVCRTLDYLVGRVGVNPGFLISSLIRAVGSDLEQSAEAHKRHVEELPSASDVQGLFDHYAGKGTLAPNAERALGGMAELIQDMLSNLPGRGRRQFPLDAWRELMPPILDSDLMYRELDGGFDEDEL